MNEQTNHNCNLNIWRHLPDEVWDKVSELYKSMPGWIGYKDGIPYWFGQEEDDVYIAASVEPSGLSFFAQMNQRDWELWITTFKSEATRVLGFDVGEPEDGFI
ncbi:hypothetical protein [Paenibacillus typhae]|uniref:hypothetical protein n=1 Tax=Paenibacillus typhae TaxID=1174501 RepID=UPI001C8E254F|nr:hypothetical protein [Paenibacillus typhae]MBY0014025.1 hypothetical protein [Paenibacillus typhae]